MSRRRTLAVAPAVIVLIAALGLAASRPGPAPAARTVVLTVRYSRFTPAALTVPAGTRLRFVVRNTDPIDHELIVGDDAVQERHEIGTEPHHGAVPGEVSIPAGETASTTFTFTAPGVVPFGCHLPGHWSYGMRGAVRVS